MRSSLDKPQNGLLQNYGTWNIIISLENYNFLSSKIIMSNCFYFMWTESNFLLIKKINLALSNLKEPFFYFNKKKSTSYILFIKFTDYKKYWKNWK